MVGTKNGWTDANHEGKKLRQAFNKLAKKLSSTNDTDDIIRLSHAMAQIAMAKNSLAKTNELEKRLEQVEKQLGLK